MIDCVAVILAGGKGSRLEPLTANRAKPAVPFGGAYRIVDFVLSNCLNSGLKRLFVLTQYKALSLDRHINLGWRNYFCRELGEYIDVLSPQQIFDENWYQGTADAVYQNIFAIERDRPELVLVLAGDHIYKMNYQRMLEYHLEHGADVTIGALEVPLDEARAFGVMQVDTQYRVTGFQEKPRDPIPLPHQPDRCLASMGIYVFDTRLMFETLCEDAIQTHSRHDFGRDIIPNLMASHRVVAFPFLDENRKSQAYWRDVGTIDAYFEANMDLVAVDPLLNMYDAHWPIRTYHPHYPPPKFVFNTLGPEDRCGRAVDSVVCPGSIISGGLVERSILGPNVRINSYSHVEDSLLFHGVHVGRHAAIRRAIVEKDLQIPAGVEIGFDLERDQAHGLTVTDTGIVVIAKGDSLEHIPPTRQ